MRSKKGEIMLDYRETPTRGSRGAHLSPLGLLLNPLALFLRTSMPFVWRILNAFLRTGSLWLRGPLSRPRLGTIKDVRRSEGHPRHPVAIKNKRPHEFELVTLGINPIATLKQQLLSMIGDAYSLLSQLLHEGPRASTLLRWSWPARGG